MKYVNFDAEKFNKTRMNAGLSLENLSEISGISVDAIKNIEYGRRKKVSKEEAEKLCKAIGIKVEDYIKADSVTKVITLITNKGGAGKTSTAVNLAAVLVKDFGKKVLCIDTDLQQNCTQHLGMLPNIDDDEELSVYNNKNFYNAFANKDDIRNHIMHTNWGGLDIVVGDDALAKIDQILMNMPLKEIRMQDILSGLLIDRKLNYDYVIIDCNPSLSKLNEIILYATDYVIIPLEAAPFGLRGVNYVIDFIKAVESQDEARVKTLGILMNKFDARKNITKGVMSIIQDSYGDTNLLFDNKIPQDTNIELAQASGEPVCWGYPKTKSYLAYKEFAGEVLNRIEQQ